MLCSKLEFHRRHAEDFMDPFLIAYHRLFISDLHDSNKDIKPWFASS